MTLEEYKAMQGKKEGPKFNLRKAGEGASIDPMWKNTRPCKAKRRDPSSTSVRLEKAPALTPCGRRPRLIRGKKKEAKRKRKKEKTRLNGTNALIASIDPMWKKATAYKREKEGGEEEEEEGEDTVEWNQRSNRQKRILDINFTFADQNQGRGGRGGRGRG